MRAIKLDFYVDDLLSRKATEDESHKLYKSISSTLQGAHMPLRKWCSYSTKLLNKIPMFNNDDHYIIKLSDDNTITTLGIIWQPTNDVFQFAIKPWNLPSNMTKQTLLSNIHKVFDPIYLVTPVFVKGKMFIQQLWSLQVVWDTVLPDDIQQRLVKSYTALSPLNKVSTPHKVMSGDSRDI